MTPTEMETTVRLVSVLWPNPRQDFERLTAGYVVALADADYPTAEAAIRRLSAAGREWPPPPGVVLHEMERHRRCSGVAAALQAHAARRVGAG